MRNFNVDLSFTLDSHRMNEWMSNDSSLCVQLRCLQLCGNVYECTHSISNSSHIEKDAQYTICAHKYQHNMEFHGVARFFFHFNHLQPNELILRWSFWTFFLHAFKIQASIRVITDSFSFVNHVDSKSIISQFN